MAFKQLHCVSEALVALVLATLHTVMHCAFMQSPATTYVYMEKL